MENKKNYYAIIPADVRYNKNLTANAKLLYGELTALSNKYGYCFASNSYFAELYGVSNTSISKWISDLKASGHIQINLKGVRKIYISALTKVNEGFEEKLKHNNTSNNTINNKKKEGTPTNVNEVKEYFKDNKNTEEEALKFFNHFESNGWKVSGRTPMKNWRAGANSWMMRAKQFNKETNIYIPNHQMNTEKEKYKKMAYNLDFPNYFEPKLLPYLSTSEINKYKQHLKDYAIQTKKKENALDKEYESRETRNLE
mgnify:CR=1 FL=1